MQGTRVSKDKGKMGLSPLGGEVSAVGQLIFAPHDLFESVGSYINGNQPSSPSQGYQTHTGSIWSTFAATVIYGDES